MALLGSLLTIIFVLSCTHKIKALTSNYYQNTCPNAEHVITKIVSDAAKKDNTVPAALLRMHFHDCFIRGCDASVLLNSKNNSEEEKDGKPNDSLHAFDVIDAAKKAVEAICPGVVSCADILAFSARDIVVVTGGPYWDVPKGRKDGTVSMKSETNQLPSPAFDLSQLQHSFSLRGLSTDDLVALSGGHTLGLSHCSSVQKSIRNYNSTHDIDPSVHPSLAGSLRSICSKTNAVTSMDTTPTVFDNTYYKMILQNKGLFSSDQALLDHPKTRSLVNKYASSEQAFYKAFANSMIKMSSISGGQEVRRDCKIANQPSTL